MRINKELLHKNQIYVIGVSGGCDSMALLNMLVNQGYKLVVAHVNYHYRHDSNIDQKIVEDYCTKHQIKYHVLEVLDKNDKDNFQKHARELRYDFYQEIAAIYKTNKVILAHHLDDVLETIYMQLERNNLKTYLGIKEVSEVNELKVIRPLLEVTKKEILKYCKDNNINYHNDYTNFETDFTRDYVRNVILVNYNDKQKQELLDKANIHNNEILKQELIMKEYYQRYDQDHKINYTLFTNQQLEHMIYYIIKQIIYPPLISNQLIQEIIKQIRSNKPNLKINLSVNAMFIKEYDNVYALERYNKKNYCLKYETLVYDKQEFFSLSDIGHLNEGVCINQEDFPIVIRTYQQGDTINTSGGTKKVSRLFINNKIPKSKRDIWPLLVRNDGVIILIPNIAKNIDYLYTKPNIFVLK